MELNYKNKKSFSLAVISLTTRVMIISRTDKNKIIATGLAQEGIEIVRNIRDNNFLLGNYFKTGIGSGSSQVQYNSNNLLSLASDVIKYDDINFYTMNTAGAQDTKFERYVNVLSYVGAESYLEIISAVKWIEFGKTYRISLRTELRDIQL